MARDKAYYEAEKKTVNNHPRIMATNARMPAGIRVFVKNSWTVFTPKGGNYGA
jgi:hypothetical protein